MQWGKQDFVLQSYENEEIAARSRPVLFLLQFLFYLLTAYSFCKMIDQNVVILKPYQILSELKTSHHTVHIFLIILLRDEWISYLKVLNLNIIACKICTFESTIHMHLQ